jgi:1-acyl-sn-glycerol-3-phosphate acyltransferase
MAAGTVWGAAMLRSRSFARDADQALGGLRPAMAVRGVHHVPPHGPCLVACNHYSRPGFGAWWLTLAISAAVAAQRAPTADPEVRWVMTAAWRFEEHPRLARVLTPATRWAFGRVAQVYGFVPMPPMPPLPEEMEARALAVRRALRVARQAAVEGGMVGLAPEGRDGLGGLGIPPRGVGTFIVHLVALGLPVLPVGVGEAEGRLRLAFGPPFTPTVPSSRAARDEAVAAQVMGAIAEQLP